MLVPESHVELDGNENGDTSIVEGNMSGMGQNVNMLDQINTSTIDMNQVNVSIIHPDEEENTPH